MLITATDPRREAGFAFHYHDDTLVSYAYDFNARIDFIRQHTHHEHELKQHLHLLQLIPTDRLPAALIERGRHYDRMRWVEERMRADRIKPPPEVIADRKVAADRLKAAINIKHMEFLEELHKELCPDCPWDGQTIFPGNPRKDIFY